MPDPTTHAANAMNSTAAAMPIIAVIGQTLGIDYVAMFYAFMGAIAWRAIQPRIAPKYDEIMRAFGWALLAMVLGTLGAVFAEAAIMHFFSMFKEINHATLIGLPATLLGFFCTPLMLKLGEVIKEWRKP